MRLMNYGKEQELGIRKLDDQHKEIINTVNHLYEIKDHGKNEILESFNALIGQLKIHFDSEENLMKEKKVIHFISHKLEHDRALSKYADYYNLYKSSKNDFDPDVLVSFKNWIENHMIKKDKKLQELAISN